MRLKKSEIDLIKSIVKSFDPDSKVFLFGSRTDNKAKGGDIDLLIITKKNTFADKLKLRVKLKEKIGDQRIDIILTDDIQKAMKNNPFINIIAEEAIPL